MMLAPRRCGFSLIELLVALTVVAILSAIAWPGYGAIIQRAHRTEAKLALLAIQHAQELHYQRHLRYSAQLATPTAEGGLGRSAYSDSRNYLLSVRLEADGQRHVATALADPLGRQARDRQCTYFTLDETGNRRSMDTQGNDTTDACWR